MTSGQRDDAHPYRWMILLAAAVIVFMTTGTRSTLGVFFKTIITDLGWDRGTISLIVAINIWLGGLLQPFAGHFMDRFGARGLFTATTALFGLGVALIAFTHSVGYLLLVYGLIIALATTGSSTVLTSALVAQWFSRQRGLALGINNAGSALGQLSLVYVSSLLLAASGWRLSHLYLGAAVIVVTVPMALLIPRQRAEATMNPALSQRREAAGPLETQSWTRALRSAPLWQLNAGYFVCGMTVALYYTHLVPFATDRGFSPATAAATFSLLAGCSVVGALLAGSISDRLGRKNILALAYLARAVSYALVLLWHHELALYLFAIIGGLSWLATPPPVMALTGEIYGLRALGTLAGISMLAHQIGGGLSVWLAGVLHDLTGSYDFSFTLAVVALLGATVVSFAIPERRYSIRYLTAAPTTR